MCNICRLNMKTEMELSLSPNENWFCYICNVKFLSLPSFEALVILGKMPVIVIVLSSKTEISFQDSTMGSDIEPIISIPSGGFLLFMQRLLFHSGFCLLMIQTANAVCHGARKCLLRSRTFSYSVTTETLNNLSSKPTRKQQKV